MHQLTAALPGGATCDHEHRVKFYENDAFLIGTVADFIAPPLRGHDAAIVVATPAHHDAFAAAIRAEGIDLDAAVADGRYLAVDAAELLSGFMVDGAPDPVRFLEAVGSVMDRATVGGREVRVYGEMVALLWAAGDVSSTIALEALWNDLATVRSFSLLCAYPMLGFGDGASADFKHICGQHTAVIPTETYPLLSGADKQQRVVAELQQETAALRANLNRRRQEQENLAELASDSPSTRSTTGDSGTGASVEVPLMARALGGLYAAGGTLALLTVLLPHSGRSNELGLLVIVANAYLVSAGLVGLARSVPIWLLPVALAWGSTLITGVAYFSAARPSPLIFFYLWVFLYSSYFFTRGQAAAQIAYVGVVYGAVLALQPPPGALAWWVVGMGTLLVTSAMIWTMRERVESLITRLYDAARTDPLTRLLNRRGFREHLDLELERARRSELAMTVLVGDVDHFKEVNDRLGHQVGDAALRRIAQVLESAKRRIDTVARVGGEEFALILPDTDKDRALVVAERLRCALLDEFVDHAVPITISFGIATFREHGETAASLLHAADDALYEAKESGRNRSLLFSREIQDLAQDGTRNRDIEGERFTAVMLDLAAAVDLRFSGSARHSETVGRYAEMMARELGLSEERIGRVRLAGLVHDIGKVAIPDSILNKAGRLSPEQFATIRTHPALGAQILEHPCLADIRSWVATHHERPDGQGYPEGLSGPKLGIEARILAVADAYEAMTSDRAYRSSIGHAAARTELKRCAGSQFDAGVVDAHLAVLARGSDRAGMARAA